MDSVLPFLLLLLSVFRSCVSSPVGTTCEDDVHVVCGSKAFHDTLNGDSFSLLNNETLATHCRDIIEDINCKKNFLSTCGDLDGAEAFSLVTDGIRDVLGDLCNETNNLRKTFNKHSSCISSLSADYEDCILNSHDNNVEEYDSDGNDIASKDAIIQRMCRFYEPFKFCIVQVTHRMCGDSAAQFVEQVAVRMAAPAVNAKCSKTE